MGAGPLAGARYTRLIAGASAFANGLSRGIRAGMSEPIRIFVGAAPDGCDAESCAVLDYTLRKHASRPLDIRWMVLSRDPSSPFYSDPETGAGWQTRAWPTVFSGFRWVVPALCGFRGRACYMDSDMIVLDDIAKLWDEKLSLGKSIIAKDAGRLCVSVWDCERAREFVLPLERLQAANGHSAMRAVMSANRSIVQPFATGNWNALDCEDLSINAAEMKIIHYTDMSAQPHLKHAIPRMAARGQRHWYDGPVRDHWRGDLISLFDTTLVEAERAGFSRENYIPKSLFGPVPKSSQVNHPGRHPR
jgi:hypothetical protein